MELWDGVLSVEFIRILQFAAYSYKLAPEASFPLLSGAYTPPGVVTTTGALSSERFPATS